MSNWGITRKYKVRFVNPWDAVSNGGITQKIKVMSVNVCSKKGYHSKMMFRLVLICMQWEI